MLEFTALCLVDCAAVPDTHWEISDLALEHVGPHSNRQAIAILQANTEHTTIAIVFPNALLHIAFR